MSTHLDTYSALSQNYNVISPAPKPPELLEDACALLELARERGPLPLQGPWRLHTSVCRELERETRRTPPGGWQGLAALLAGTDAFEVRADGFHDLIGAQVLAARGEHDLRRAIVESLTVRLVPPASAAGLFLLIGLHPGWGLRLANEVHTQLGQEPESDLAKVAGLFPADTLELVRRGVFGATISVIFETLRTLEADQAYPIDALADIVWSACRFGHDFIEREHRHIHTPGLDLFIDHLTQRASDTKQRAVDFTILDLLDHFLVPAGIARRFDDQTFCIWPEHIPQDATVYGEGPLSKSRWLCRFLTNDRNALVA